FRVGLAGVDALGRNALDQSAPTNVDAIDRVVSAAVGCRGQAGERRFVEPDSLLSQERGGAVTKHGHRIVIADGPGTGCAAQIDFHNRVLYVRHETRANLADRVAISDDVGAEDDVLDRRGLVDVVVNAAGDNGARSADQQVWL